MDNISKCPIKLFIQDIYRAQETSNKYVYEIFGQNFKNLMIHGVITALYNNNGTTTNLELSDPTGTVQIYYDSSKNNSSISASTVKDLRRGFEKATRFGDPNVLIMNTLMDRVTKKYNQPIIFEEGGCLSVVGDIFIDDLKDIRMVSAYQCMSRDIEHDLIWLEELHYLYEKYYIPKINTSNQMILNNCNIIMNFDRSKKQIV